MKAFELDTTLKTGDDYFQSYSNIDKRFPLYAQICLLRSRWYILSTAFYKRGIENWVFEIIKKYRRQLESVISRRFMFWSRKLG